MKKEVIEKAKANTMKHTASCYMGVISVGERRDKFIQLASRTVNIHCLEKVEDMQWGVEDVLWAVQTIIEDAAVFFQGEA